jgi:hypothetical protein
MDLSQCVQGLSDAAKVRAEGGKSMTFGELTSGKLLGFRIQKLLALCMVSGDGTEVLQRCGGYTYEQGELRGRVGEERGGNEMDRCPLTDRIFMAMVHLVCKGTSVHLLTLPPLLSPIPSYPLNHYSTLCICTHHHQGSTTSISNSR